MRAHQPGSTPIDIPETVPNPAHTPAPAPERTPTKAPEKVPEKISAARMPQLLSDPAQYNVSGGCPIGTYPGTDLGQSILPPVLSQKCGRD